MYKRLIPNPRIFCISILIIVVSLKILYYIRANLSKNVEEVAEGKIIVDKLVYECCTPLNITLRKNLFFLKTHKTGSTTVQNVILRFAEKYSQSVMWPMYLTYYQPLSKKSLIPKTITADNKYNILASHMRYTSELKSYQYPGTKMVTILRHPASLFQSIYEYFRMEINTKMTLEQFVKAAEKPPLWVKGSVYVYRGYNQMSVDLGFNLTNANNITAIHEFVDKIDREFDFVMITEEMETSLILLANLMGWPLEYVVHLKLNTRPPSQQRYELTEEDELVLMELNKVDMHLYRHFLKKFQKCVQQYGVHEINKKILELRKMNMELRERCVAGENEDGVMKSVNYVLKNSSDLECVSAIRDQRIGP